MFKRLKSLLSAKATEATTANSTLPQDADSLLINAYCTRAALPELDFLHQANARRDLSDPELAGHLSGFAGYIASRGNGQMTRIRYHVIRHIQRVQQHLSLSIAAEQLDAFSDWAVKANALAFFPDGSVRDPWGRILVSGTDGEADPAAEIPYPPEAWQRKTRIDAFLSTRELRVPPHLPPLVSEPELQLRTASEVAHRALALFVVALRAESIATNGAIPVSELQEQFPLAFRQLTPKEHSFLEQARPSETDTVQFAWRYESLFVLVWALGLIESLPFPTDICDVPLLASIMTNLDGEELAGAAVLKPASEILEALDLHYRLHWLIRQAQFKQQEIPAGLESGVIPERHHALNWLVRFEDKAWDEVDTPT